MMQFQENARTEGMMERGMEGRADKHYFIVLVPRGTNYRKNLIIISVKKFVELLTLASLHRCCCHYLSN